MSLELTAQIILLAQKRSVTANFIIKHTGTDLAKRSVQRHLQTLHRLGFLEIEKELDCEIFYKMRGVA